ncbi:uncharacterized protein At1g65710-like isoform X2 [Rhodamnia argentea]|uniref:Uncharacterized protein At1g65710-like isoform X2 n=1 Tax=Rhodamnia argentea TaxID=178133 RepID=A0A8B8PRG6_9MYRT|nr:uncharacterized protein At1g65710-like isoform X2 [Rhodamnia argentea]
MGNCFSKKSPSTVVAYGSSSAVKPPPDSNPPCRIDVTKAEREPSSKTSPPRNHQRKEAEQEGFVKKEVFIIKHRKSQDRRTSPEEKLAVHGVAPVVDAGKSGEDAAQAVSPLATSSNGGESLPVNGASAVGVSAGVRTSSCTKEEVDAILIQCGRLSRSSSGRAGAASGGRVYSGSKRSYDFDNQNDDGAAARAADAVGREQPEMNEDELGEKRQHRQRHRQSTPSRSHSQGSGSRRRTPSREREQRSSSRERRVSRSPARRSENTSLSNSNASATAGGSGNNSRPGKMVSVPASLVEKSNCGGDPPESQATVKRISVKRNVGEAQTVSRSAASPRSRSPARQMSGGVGKQQNSENQPSLSRNSSRKAEQSPHRRNPLSEIDTNARQQQPQPPSNKSTHKATEDGTVKEVEARVTKPTVDCDKTGGKVTEDNKGRGCDSAEKEQQAVMEVLKRQAPMSGLEREKPQGLARSRSSRLSELELNPQIVPEPASYTSLLLEDIQNFHQKQTTTFSVPACVTKACSIYEAVADLNSNKSSNATCALSELRKVASNQCSHNGYNSSYSGNDLVRKSEGRDPFVESELAVDDDLMEPSIHKYVTVKRGGLLKGDDKEEIESSGSNSFVGSGTQQWGVSSSWEPCSADSSDCWTSTSNSKAVVDDFNALAFQRIAVSESGRQASESRRDLNVKRRDSGARQNGIGRSRT